MIRVIIIEDEQAARGHLLEALASTGLDISVMAAISSVSEGISCFSSGVQPDIILSDVQLSDGLSFEIFQETRLRIPVVFITGYDQFMMNAFAYNGIDYLLKPVDSAELSKALTKYQQFQAHFIGHAQSAVERLVGSFPSKRRSRILARRGLEHVSLRLEEVVYFYTENKVTYTVDRSGRKYLCDKTLSELEEELDRSQFFRANRQYIVNIEYIRSYKAYEKVKLQLDLSIADSRHFIVISQETAPSFRKWMAEN